MHKTKFIITGLLLVLLLISCETKTKNKSNQITTEQKVITKPFASQLEWTGIKIEDKNYTI